MFIPHGDRLHNPGYGTVLACKLWNHGKQLWNHGKQPWTPLASQNIHEPTLPPWTRGIKGTHLHTHNILRTIATEKHPQKLLLTNSGRRAEMLLLSTILVLLGALLVEGMVCTNCRQRNSCVDCEQQYWSSVLEKLESTNICSDCKWKQRPFTGLETRQNIYIAWCFM